MAECSEIGMVRKLILSFLLLNAVLLFSVPKLTGDLDEALELSEPGNLHSVISEVALLCDAALLVGDDGTAVLIPACTSNPDCCPCCRFNLLAIDISRN